MARDGSEELIRALHREHAARLWGYCLRLTEGDAVRAQDVCQETMVRAWQHPDALARPPAGVQAWLFTVARNIVIDQWRAKRARPESPTADLPERADERDHVDNLLQSWLVADAMRALSAEHREILHTCYFQGHSVRDAATALGLPEGTVKSRTHYALRALRLALEEMGVAR